MKSQFLHSFMRPRLFVIGFTLLLIGANCGAPADGGVFRSLDSGASWEQKTYVGEEGRRIITISDANIASLAMDPHDPNIVYAGTKGSGLYVTLDGGEQWHPTKISTGNVYSIAIHPFDSNIVYLSRDTNILRTRDGGETWENVYTDIKAARVNKLIVDSYEPNRVYAATSAGAILKSFDSGDNWELRLQLDSSIEDLLMANHDTRIVYALDGDGQVHRTLNGGEPIVPEGSEMTGELINSGWSEVVNREFKQQFEGASKAITISLDPNDTEVVYMVTKRGLQRSENNGESWEDVPTLIGFQDKQNQNIRLVTVLPGNAQTIYFTIASTFYMSTNRGDTWTTINTFPSRRKLTALLVDYSAPNVLYVATEEVQEKKGLIRTSN